MLNILGAKKKSALAIILFSAKRMKFIKKIVPFLLQLVILLTSSCGILKHEKKHSLSQNEKLQNTEVFINGCKEQITGDYDKAIISFLTCIKADPENSAALYELAGVYYMLKKDTDAMPLIKKAVELEPDNVWYQLLYANLLIAGRQYKDATAIYEKLAKAHPESLDYYFDWAEGYLYMEKYTDAIAVYDLVEGKIGVSEDISVQKEKIYLELKKIDKAADEIKKLIKAFPSETTYYNYLADLYLDNNMVDKAFEIYQQILVLDPDNANVHLSLADYYRKEGDNDKSFNELKLAFSNENLDVDTKVKILLSYYTLTEKSDDLKSQAYTLIDSLIKTHPDEAKAYSIYGDFLLRDKKYTEAKVQYLKVVSLDSSKYDVWAQLLLLESELNNNDALLSESKRAMELFPDHPALYLFNGVANFQLKKYDEAIIALNKGVALVVYDDDMLKNFYTYLGDSYYAKKNSKDAYAAYDKVLEIDPKNTYVLNNYSYYLSLQGDNLDKAEKMAKKLVDQSDNNASYLDTYGWVLYKEKKYTDAEIWLNKALLNGGDSSSVILEHYGDVMFNLGSSDKALIYWKKAKEKGKGSEFLDKKINYLKLYE
jgi:tetratricopeptide (TPR) repeat protein